MQSKPLLVWQSVLAALQVIAGASELANLIPGKYVAFFIIMVAALQVGTATFVHGLVTVPQQTPVVLAEKGTTVTVEAEPSQKQLDALARDQAHT